MKRPFCTINKKKHQLYIVSGVIRFEDKKPEIIDLNRKLMSYFLGAIKLKEIFDYYITSGTSYEVVRNIFSINGGNNHIVTQGKGRLKTFKLYR